jgi:hypothetical protein
MPRRLIDVTGAKPLLDIASYARRGPGCRDRLSQDDVELIARTVGRTPEVMVKVLSRGGKDLKAVGSHVAYLNRGGDLDIETDDGQRLSGKGVEKELLENWDLDLEERRSGGREYWSRRSPPRLVHKLMFSMPAGTPPGKVLAAVKNFAREEFGLKHRYAMVLHTDEPHPHVHMVVKAVSEQGVRLNIRKATLREWRSDFARHLRAVGVPANATHRNIRGETTPRKSDGIYRAGLRGHSTHIRDQVETVARELASGHVSRDPGREALLAARRNVQRAWAAIGEVLSRQGLHDLAGRARRFTVEMPTPMTEREYVARQLLERANARAQSEPTHQR